MLTTKNVDRTILPTMMLEYVTIKDNFENEVLLYRVGDFYESYFQDAPILSRVSEISLTEKVVSTKKRKQSMSSASSEIDIQLDSNDLGEKLPIPMAGFPHYKLPEHTQKLISASKRVVVVDQMEDPKKVKGRNVIRKVTKILSSMSQDGQYLSEYLNNFICTIFREDKIYGLSFADVSTGECFCTSVDNMDSLFNEIDRYKPSELVVDSDMLGLLGNQIETRLRLKVMITVESTAFDMSGYVDKLLKSFSVNTIDEFKFKNDIELKSLTVLLNYIEYTQKLTFNFGKLPEFYDYTSYMYIDMYSRRNLELSENIFNSSNNNNTLISVLDFTKTSMGSRLLRQWIKTPLLSKLKIEYRLNGVTELKSDFALLQEIQENFEGILDIYRIVGRLKLKNVHPKDLVNLKYSLYKVPKIREYLSKLDSDIFKDLFKNVDTFEDLVYLLDTSILEEPNNDIREGFVLKPGFSTDLDKARDMVVHSEKYITDLEEEERKKTGIKNLKVVNKNGKCTIEITKSWISKVPDYFHVEKANKTGTKYVTTETQRLEKELYTAMERSKSIEIDLYEEIKEAVSKESNKLILLCEALSTFDVLCSLAYVAVMNHYVCPKINKEGCLDVKGARHPVVEKSIDERFIPNDVDMDIDNSNFMLITGPNMAGKSTYMRQVALIVIMAHIGSYVPADSAEIPITDKIFTRIGASDDISSGRSTYMVEMVEVKNILENATKNSLVLLDEVGRGTSTSDGLSIAQSLVEYIVSKIGCKTLFATHYHELIHLEESLKTVHNYHMSVNKKDGNLTFLRKLEKGGLSESYGIDVAELAGLPSEVINRAWEVLNTIEGNRNYVVKPEIQEKNEVLDTIKGLNKGDLSPVSAYKLLCDLIDMCS